MTKEALFFESRRTYPRSRKELIKQKVNIESEWSPWYKPAPLLPYEKKKLNLTPAAIVGMAGNCIKYILP